MQQLRTEKFREGVRRMRTDTRPIQITVANPQADAEGVIRSLPESREAFIVDQQMDYW